MAVGPATAQVLVGDSGAIQIQVLVILRLWVKANPLLCIYSPAEGWQGVNFELPDGDAKKLAEWRANFAKTMTELTDLPELGPGAFRANQGGVVKVHGLAKKGLLIVTGSFKADVEVQLWKRIASDL